MKKNIFINSFLFFIFVSTNTFAKETYFDLSQNEIMIETNFDGKEIIIFGLLEDNHDTILTIKGPKKKLKLQKKDRYFGVWFNTKRITYSNVPNIFFFGLK